MNLADEQLIGHGVLISEEEGYQKKALIIWILINWKSGTDFILKKLITSLFTLVQPPDSIFNKYVKASVFFAFMNIFYGFTWHYEYHLTFKYRYAEEHLNLSFYFTYWQGRGIN